MVILHLNTNVHYATFYNSLESIESMEVDIEGNFYTLIQMSHLY